MCVLRSCGYLLQWAKRWAGGAEVQAPVCQAEGGQVAQGQVLGQQKSLRQPRLLTLAKQHAWPPMPMFSQLNPF